MGPNDLVRGVVVLLLGICSPSLLAQETRPPEYNAPAASTTTTPFVLAVVDEGNKSTGEITFNYTVLRSMAITQTEGNVTSVQVRAVPEIRTTTVPLALFSLYDAKGNNLTAGAFLGRVKRADVILIYEGGRCPDPKYLRVFKDDTLILVRGDRSTAPIPADPTPPLGYVPHAR